MLVIRKMSLGEERVANRLKAKDYYLEESVSEPASDSSWSGWELIFSAPDAVSSAWRDGDSETTKVIIEGCQQVAVGTALAVAEEECGITDDLEKVRFRFVNFTSKGEEARLRTHSLLFKKGTCEDGRTEPIPSHLLYKQQKALGRIYRQELAGLLTERGMHGLS